MSAIQTRQCRVAGTHILDPQPPHFLAIGARELLRGDIEELDRLGRRVDRPRIDKHERTR